jgi:hypothetical protein
VIVGVGRGVAALAALDSGCVPVIGLDCGSEYDLKRVRNGYPPEAVLHSDRAARFSWSDLTLPQVLSSASVADSVIGLGEVAEGHLVLIDPSPHLTVDEFCQLPLEALGHALIGFRFQCDVSSVHKLKLTISYVLNLIFFKTYTYKSSLVVIAVGYMSHWVYSRDSQGPSERIWNGGPPSFPPRVVSIMPDLQLISCTRLSLGLLASKFKRKSLARALSDLLAEAGKDLVSSNYQEWTHELFKIITLWLLLECDNPADKVLEMINQEEISIYRGDTRYSISDSSLYYYHLLAGPVAYLVSRRNLL